MRERVFMTEDEQDAASHDEPPKTRAMTAMQNAAERLAAAHEDADNAAVAGAAEQEHVDEFVDELAKALDDGLDKAIGFYAGAVADEAEYYSKTDLKQEVKDRVEELRGADKQSLDEFVQQRLEKVTIVKTTDHRQGAEYIFDFDTFKVETRSGRDGRGHFRFDQFRNLLLESGGVNTGPPQKDRRGGEEWRDFMIDMIDDRGEERRTRGARTKAFEALSNKLTRLTGYGTAESALDHTGVWVLREGADVPDWWQGLGAVAPGDDRDLRDDVVREVRVHESVIEPILEDAEITRSALYHELDARNHTVPGTSGASMTEWVNGSDERFWTLRPSAGSPRVYVPAPNAGIAVTVGAGLPAVEEQSDEQTDTTTNPASSGADDAHRGSDGFDSVGDTA